MKDRLKKKADKRKRRLIHELLDRVLEINGLEPRAQELTGNQPTVFFDFSGHIGCIHIRLHDNGWISEGSWDREVIAHTYVPGEIRAAITRIKNESPAAGPAGDSGN